MAKSTGILLNPETGDLQVNNKPGKQDQRIQGTEIGYITYQNQALILQASKGEFKEHPWLGAAITEMANDHETVGWKREILLQLQSDDMNVKQVEIDYKNKKMEIDAEYD